MSTFHKRVDQAAYARNPIVAARVTFIDAAGNEVLTGTIHERPYKGAAYCTPYDSASQEYQFARRVTERFRDALFKMGAYKADGG